VVDVGHGAEVGRGRRQRRIAPRRLHRRRQRPATTTMIYRSRGGRIRINYGSGELRRQRRIAPRAAVTSADPHPRRQQRATATAMGGSIRTRIQYKIRVARSDSWWRKHLATLLGWASNLRSMRRHRCCWLPTRPARLEPAAALRPLLACLEVGGGEEKGGTVEEEQHV